MKKGSFLLEKTNMADLNALKNAQPEEVNSNARSGCWYNFIRNDRSWTCIVISITFLGIVLGLSAALVYTNTGIHEYFNPPPFVPPNILYSVYDLIPRIRYDFYEKEETIEIARKICDSRNATILHFPNYIVGSKESLDEEDAFDCYMNFRNNAEDRNHSPWVNETLYLGGPPPLFFGSARYGSFQPTDQHKTPASITEEWVRITRLKNGCDIKKGFHDLIKNVTEEMKSEKVTVINYVKRYGSYGVRLKNAYVTNMENGCWHEIEDPQEKHLVVCRKELIGDSAYRAAVSKDPILKKWNYDPKDPKSKFWNTLCPKKN